MGLLDEIGIGFASVVSKLLGHTKLQTTEIYREVNREGIEMALAKAVK